jgi:carbonic anhydrase
LLGHASSDLIRSSIEFLRYSDENHLKKYGANFGIIAEEIIPAIERVRALYGESEDQNNPEWIDEVTKAQMVLSVESILRSSHTIRELIQEGRVALVGLLYDASTGRIEVIESASPH